MSLDPARTRLELPAAISEKLTEFRRTVWTVKLIEGILAALFGLTLSYLVVFVLDRFWDTPAAARGLILIGGAVGLGFFFPLKCHRWLWRNRKMEAVARLLRHAYPRLSDQLVGVVELVRNESEQSRSEALIRAALNQVNEDVKQRDLSGAVPDPKHRKWAWAAGVPILLAVAAIVIVPAAGFNALGRWLAPWGNLERYTFAQLERLPDSMVVPYAEPFQFDAELSKTTAWSPTAGSVRYGEQQPITSPLAANKYGFEIPAQKDAATLRVAVGDDRADIAVQPTVRPELTSMTAHIELPDYLQYPAGITQDIRGGAISLLQGAKTSFRAIATRELVKATVDGVDQKVEENQLITDKIPIKQSSSKEFHWVDKFGLTPKEAFVVDINALSDEEPQIDCARLSRQQVVLESDVLSFDIRAWDDFGIKRVGLEWSGIEDPLRNPSPSVGEKVVAAGDPQSRELHSPTTFSAKREGVRPQTLEVRAYAEDYLPDRERSYSAMYVFHILSPEEHAIWLTQQFGRWYRQAQEVYEREQQLHGLNRELRGMDPAELDDPENRRRIEQQAAAERANSARLGSLTKSGKQLVEKATRNDQFNVATLETLAEMIQKLDEIANKKMPSVADLLAEAAQAPGSGKPSQPKDGSPSEKPGPKVGKVRDGSSGNGKSEPGKSKNKVPSINDVESGWNEIHKSKNSKSKSGGSKFTLPSTTVKGGGLPPKDNDQAPPAQQKVDEAVEEQADLLAEFDKVREELDKILGNLEGSTFVKRLKAASRRQLEVADDLNSMLDDSFGVSSAEINGRSQEKSGKIAEREVAQSDSVYVIQEDLEAYFNRRQEGKFKAVLEEMRGMQVSSKLRDIGQAVTINLNGQSIAKAEFWADNLDRWAEQLVGPGCPNCGPCPGSKSPKSLPPSIVLEVMKILEEEIQLREETRSVQQAKDAIESDEFSERATALSISQIALQERTLDVTDQIRELPDSFKHFGKEMLLLSQVAGVMGDAQEILATPNTGPEAIAAETEAIELLLQARRCNPKGGGGGGGATPGGGGGGDTNQSALTQIGPGSDQNANVVERQVGQATGTTGSSRPEEFRAGLDAYFNAIEGGRRSE